jgi:CDP-diacylglycerol--serine O-phosphatidyltransferase
VDTRFFVGLPTPPAAAATASIFYFLPPASTALWPDGLMMGALILNGALMVSTFRYLSFKQFDLTRRWSYRNAVLLGAFLLLIAYNPPTVLFSAAVAYVLSGPVGTLVSRALRHRGGQNRYETDKKVRW